MALQRTCTNFLQIKGSQLVFNFTEISFERTVILLVVCLVHAPAHAKDCGDEIVQEDEEAVTSDDVWENQSWIY